jgi:hypothetical protein
LPFLTPTRPRLAALIIFFALSEPGYLPSTTTQPALESPRKLRKFGIQDIQKRLNDLVSSRKERGEPQGKHFA